MVHWEQSFISQKYGTAAFRPKKVTQKTSSFFGVARLDAQPWVFPYNSRFLWIRQEVYIQFLLVKSLFLLVYVIPMFVAETCWNYHLSVVGQIIWNPHVCSLNKLNPNIAGSNLVIPPGHPPGHYVHIPCRTWGTSVWEPAAYGALRHEGDPVEIHGIP